MLYKSLKSFQMPNQTVGPLTDFIVHYTQQRAVPFHTPGHCGNQQGIATPLFDFWGQNVFLSDLSEITGLDDLHHPTGLLKESQDMVKNILGAQDAYYLVNGSTAGILAVLHSLLHQGDKVIIPKNAHKSIINSIILTQAEPLFMYPEWCPAWNIYGAVKVEDLAIQLENNKDVKAVIVTCPTYEGIASDLTAIAALTKRYDVPFIVDAAHGFLWNFMDPACLSHAFHEADVVIYSVHKTGGSLTQSALMIINDYTRINPSRLQQSLNMFQSTSPSYLLLASLESAILSLNTRESRIILQNLWNQIKMVRDKLRIHPKFQLLPNEDIFKIVLKSTYLNAESLYQSIWQGYKIEVEQVNENFVMFLCGIGTEETYLNSLYDSLTDIISRYSTKIVDDNRLLHPIQTVLAMLPYEAYHSKSNLIQAAHAVGKISQETVVTCPPGIPVLIPGERITEEHAHIIGLTQHLHVVDL